MRQDLQKATTVSQRQTETDVRRFSDRSDAGRLLAERLRTLIGAKKELV